MLKKKVIHVKKRKSPVRKIHSSGNVEKVLVENFVALQKVMTSLSSKFDNLSSQISQLLDLFEVSAKSLAKKDFSLDKKAKADEEVVGKLNNLFEQNKIIARGLTLMHESNSLKPKHHIPSKNHVNKKPKPLGQKKSSEVGETGVYQKSITSEQKNEPSKP